MKRTALSSNQEIVESGEDPWNEDPLVASFFCSNQEIVESEEWHTAGRQHGLVRVAAIKR